MRAAPLLVAGVLLMASPALSAEGEDALPGVGAEAPAFALPVYNAEAARLARAGTMLLVGEDAEDQGCRLIVVSFMASHCKPCNEELPFLQRLHEKYAEKGLRLIGVSIDSDPEGQKKMGELLAQHRITFPVVKDGYTFTARRYLGDKVPLPSVFVLDRAGTISFVSRGYSEEISRKLVEELQRGLGVAVEAIAPAAAAPPAPAAAPAAAAPKPAKKAAAKKGKKRTRDPKAGQEAGDPTARDPQAGQEAGEPKGAR